MTQPLTSVRTCTSVEEMDAFPAEMGWPLEYRQIEAGAFSSTSTELEGESWFLLEEQSSRTVEVVTGGAPGMFVLALVEGDSGVMNGQALLSSHIYVQPPDTDVRAILSADMKVTQIGIAAELFEGTLHAVAPGLKLPDEKTTLFNAPSERLENMRAVMRAILAAPSDREAIREEAASNIVTDIISAALDCDGEPYRHDLFRANARHSIDRAKEYIEAHLSESIRMESLCLYANTTQRSLERYFARELGISPQQYVKARRLNAARRSLLAADKERGHQITDIAQSYGFNHLGWFACDYRRYFGESPQETLTRS